MKNAWNLASRDLEMLQGLMRHTSHGHAKPDLPAVVAWVFREDLWAS